MRLKFAAMGLLTALIYVDATAAPQIQREDWERFIPKRPVAKNVDCFDMNVRSFETFQVCRRINPQSSNLVIHFHGAGQDARSLFRTDKPDPVLTKIAESKLTMPSIISVSTGRVSWLGTHKGDQYGSMGAALQQLISGVRAKAKANKIILYGVSMGGFNGLQVLLHQGQIFDKAILSCPALTEADPFSDASWDADPDTRLAKPFSRAGYRLGLKREFGSSSDWRESNPMQTLKSDRIQALSGKQILITTVGQDGFGFINTPVKAARLMQGKGLSVQHLKTDSAEHCKPAPGPLAEFLAM